MAITRVAVNTNAEAEADIANMGADANAIAANVGTDPDALSIGCASAQQGKCKNRSD